MEILVPPEESVAFEPDNPRPDYHSLKLLALKLKRPVETLYAQVAKTDPFYAGMACRRTRAEWFAAIWNTHQFRKGIHIRGIHYILISQEKGSIKTPDGMPYVNSDECYDILGDASG